MARSGINKVLVMKAREALISRGENPSIDAIRVALGNTGSKSTIHRYLREIEEEKSAQLDDEALISKPINELVARLAAVLKQEAQVVIEENQTKHQRQTQALAARINDLEEQLTKTNEKLEKSQQDLKGKCTEYNALQASEESLKVKESEARQTGERLQAMLAERQAQIESLEEKHRHSREAMAHYRESVKGQREQDQRKHEQQTQALQVEIRALNQTLSVKQLDITQLNKDNGRLAAELGAAQKHAASINSDLRQLAVQLESKEEELRLRDMNVSELKAQTQDMDKAIKENEVLLEWKSNAAVSAGRLEGELSAKTEMMDHLLAEIARLQKEKGNEH